MDTPATVVVRDLRKRYGPIEAVRGLDFDIHPGEIFGLIGPNGAGKTTTIECVLGLRQPDAGTIVVCGLDTRQHPQAVKEKIGAALQTTALQDKITPREALDLFGAFYRTRTPTPALLERFSLVDKADATFDSLSGGQRQRLALALAFVNAPTLVFLDEPTTGLDAHASRELRAEIARMKDDGYTVLLTTHDIDDAEHLCDRVAIVDRGTIIASGTPREIMNRSTARPTITIETATPALDLLGVVPLLEGVVPLDGSGRRLRCRSASPAEAVRVIAGILEQHAIGLVELHVQPATLEDVFVELTGHGLGQPDVHVPAGSEA